MNAEDTAGNSRTVVRGRWREFAVASGLRVLVAVIIVVVWEGVILLGFSTPFWISEPRMLAARLATDVVTSEFWFHAFVTLYETLIGLASGAILGGISGFLLARHRLLDIALEPYLAALYSLPRVALAPLFILWFGIGLMSKVMLAVSIVFFIMLYSVYSGVRNVDADLLDSIRTMGASDRYLTRRIVLPSCVPFIFSGLRISLGMALIGTVVGEMIASQKGLGRLISISSGSFDTTGLFSTFVVLAGMAMGLGAIMKSIERRLQRWQEDPIV